MTWTRSAITAGCLLTLGSCTVINPTFGDSGSTGSTSTAVGTSEQTTTLSSTGSSGSVGSDSLSSTQSSSTGGVGPSSSASGGMESTDGTDTVGFIGTTGECLVELPDGVLAHCSESCSTFTQDCARGDACKPWSNDGTPSWNAVRCSGLDETPAAAGDACTVEGGAYSGIDTCGEGLLCWGVNIETKEGTCVELCGGSPKVPECGFGDFCSLEHQGVLSVCLPECDPLTGACSDGEDCVHTPVDLFGCAPPGASVCPAGLAEVDPGQVVDCEAGEPCCTSLCDLNDAECEAGECMALFEAPPPGYDDVGVCVSAM